MKSIHQMTEAELAAYVACHLEHHGIRVVLSGGTCVTIYARNRYVSGDLDLVPETSVKPQKVEAALSEIGFRRQDRVFGHPESAILVDIRVPPLAVGNEPVKQITEMPLSTGVLRLLSPTDCVKDRLAAYYYHNDLQCLEQACLVVECSDVDLAEVKRWSVHEGEQAKFSQVRCRLAASAKKRR